MLPKIYGSICFYLVLLVLQHFTSQKLLLAEESELRFEADVSEGWTIEVLSGDGSKVKEREVVPIRIGREWESVLGEKFDGKAIYRTRLTERLPVDKFSTWWLEIDGAATDAMVRMDGQIVGKHLGGWTPFRIDVTEWVRKQSDSYQPQVEIELDERVGHNTQGFLPIVVPHFGGLWKSVKLIGTQRRIYIDDLQLRVGGFRGQDRIELDAPVANLQLEDAKAFRLEYRLQESGKSVSSWSELRWQDVAGEPQAEGHVHFMRGIGEAEPITVRRWSPEDPFLYEIELRLIELATGQPIDSVVTKAAIREIKVDGRKLLLNGKPIAVRGLLNWGYAPPRISPSISPDWMQQELLQAKSYGFNLMKFCLWMPPKRYLEMADEMGVLVWMEYPTWHPDFSANKLSELRREFKEFFQYDRNHPSVVVRSLTCETGPGADLKVVQDLYQLAHQEIPGAVVEDDSSWIQWNRVHDFYDDHPYGNNHTWRGKLEELDQYISQREPKPLLLGEAIAADTWVTEEELQQTGPAAEGVHAPLSADKLAEYRSNVEKQSWPEAIAELPETSRRYAWLMRKFQIETFRDRFPDQGYVVSVIRDFPLASMGMVDRAGQWKWKASEFSWHRDAMFVLRVPEDRRLLFSGEQLQLEVACVQAGESEVDLTQATWRWSKVDDLAKDQPQALSFSVDSRGRKLASIPLKVPRVSESQLWRLEVQAAGANPISNHWDLWIAPRVQPNNRRVFHHSSVSTWLGDLSAIPESGKIQSSPWNGVETDGIILTRRWDRQLWQAALAGARVIMFPENSPGSLAVREHWFLRGGPIHGPEHSFWKHYSRSMLSDVQHFDWSGPVMFDNPLFSEVTPIAFLWDNHDLKFYRSHLLAFDCRVGNGRWLASSLALGKQPSITQAELLQQLIRCIADDSVEVRALSREWLDAIAGEIDSKAVSLAEAKWLFKPDQSNLGLKEKWFDGSSPKNDWKPITIDKHWEAHGYESLDGWGWYYTEVSIPEDLMAKSADGSLFIQFTGADDYFELFVDGELIGSGGDPELKQTAFELRKSFVLPKKTIADGKLAIAVRIQDWQGAGGLFRPIYLSNRPIREQAPVLVESR